MGENEANKNDSDSPATNKNGVTNDSLSNKRRELWIKSLGQLPTDDADYVKHLKLFAQKLSTGLPQYKIKKRVIKLREPEEVTVTCTWNNFIFDGVGSSKAEAEKESARVMLNMVRKLCKMKEIPKTKNIFVPKAKVKMSEEDALAIAYHKVVESNLEPVDMLEEISGAIDCEGPEFVVSSVETKEESVEVTVTCSWRSWKEVGVASSKRLAEVEAARFMLAKLEKLPKPAKTVLTVTDNERIDVVFSDVEIVEVGGVKMKRLPPGVETDNTKYCHFPPDGAASVTITRKDFCCLQDEQFLNDVIIDFYLKFLQCGVFAKDVIMQERTHIFSNYFYNRLTQKHQQKKLSSNNAPQLSAAERGYNNVKKWTKNTNIFDKDFVIVPINDNDHWYVVVICFPGLITSKVEGGKVKRPIMLIMDSLEDGIKERVVKALRSYLSCEWREKMVKTGREKDQRDFKEEDMPSVCPEIPQQPNLTDCGLYVLEYIEAFFRSPIEDFSVPLASLKNWFTSDHAQGKRATIAGLIKRLATQQNPGTKFRFPSLGFSKQEEQKYFSELELEEDVVEKIDKEDFGEKEELEMAEAEARLELENNSNSEVGECGDTKLKRIAKENSTKSSKKAKMS